jgi:ketosteroid isomerase-like protein
MTVQPRQDSDTIEHIFRAWDEALGAKDLDASMALYHQDATLESPLVRHLRSTEEGVIRGRENLVRLSPRSWRSGTD